MTTETAIVFIIIAVAVYLFTRGNVPVDLSALIIMALLLITGVLTPAEGISGFSNAATVTIAAMFILSSGLFKSGALSFFETFLINRFNKNFWLGLLSLMLIAASLSAFINVTAIVAMFIPVVIGASAKANVSPSKLLMPLSFAALFGGVSTLIGTSTNILVSSIAFQHGLEPISMFEMLPFGLVVLAVGIIYMMLVGVRLLPGRRSPDELIQNFGLHEYITDLQILPGSELVDTKLDNSFLSNKFQIKILELRREKEPAFVPTSETILKGNDLLKIKCSLQDLRTLQRRDDLKIKSGLSEDDLTSSDDEKLVIEAIIPSNSDLRGRTVGGVAFKTSFGANVLAIRHRGRVMKQNIEQTRLVPGDVLLLEIEKNWLPKIKQNSSFVVASEFLFTDFDKRKSIIATIIMVSVVATAALNILPIVATAIIGSVTMILTGVISLEEAYKAIEWKVIFLIAGVLTLGIALENTGGAELVADGIVNIVGSYGNQVLLSAFFFLTLVFTNFMSNNATAALLAPIAILTADSLGLNSRPFLMAVTYAASLSLITPIGYQTNTMIYGPGKYKFSDYVKVGTPLDIILWLLASILLPIIFPF